MSAGEGKGDHGGIETFSDDIINFFAHIEYDLTLVTIARPV